MEEMWMPVEINKEWQEVWTIDLLIGTDWYWLYN